MDCCPGNHMLERVQLETAESVAEDYVFVRLSQLRILQLFGNQSESELESLPAIY
jgi:hypothetical protein